MAEGRTEIELKGQVERVTFFNEENHYTVARMRIQGRIDLVTVVGSFYSLTPGEELKIRGYWERHVRYGEQFKALSYESVMPATVKGIEKYLGSGMIKGIGPVTAKRLVARFGVETLEVIDTAAERLAEVPGIGEKRIEMIRQAWEEQRDVRDIMIFLQGQGVSPAYAVKIYKHYGKNAVAVVTENPYRLASDIFGIGFVTADRIAEKLGVSRDSPMRAEAGIIFVLNGLAEEGHVYFPRERLIAGCCSILEMERKGVEEALDTLTAGERVGLEDIPGTDDTAVYLAGFLAAEQGIADHLSRLAGRPKQSRLLHDEDPVAWAQKNLSISLTEHQKEAVRRAVEEKVMVVTGGPGTGKTTIITAIIKVYERMGQKVLLAAPTGRAAKRMTEATGHEARTLHRLLEYSPGAANRGGGFKRDDRNPLDGDLIIIDEVSMVDTILMYHVLKAIPDEATLVLVGDADQLPSVGPGSVLMDIIASGRIPTCRLTAIFRQSRESMIIVNAHRVNSGLMPVLQGDEGHIQDFHFVTVEGPEEARDQVLRLIGETIPRRFGYDPVRDIQVITPMHRGTAGVASLNGELQRQLNPRGTELTRAGRTLRVGDKVMQVRNNYDKDVYNGDLGRIARIDTETQDLVVDYDGKMVTYDFTDLDEIVLAYAISVHKSQGSEYPAVVMPILTQHYILLQRNLLYTAITRGRKLVVLVGTRKALAIAIRNNKPQERYTMLRGRIARALSGR